MDLKTGATRRVSPGAGKTTCGYFHPKLDKIIFASSHLDPDAKKHYEIERKAARRGKSDQEAPPLCLGLRSVYDDLRGQPRRLRDSNGLTDAKGYNAEGSYSADGKQNRFLLQSLRRKKPRTLHHGRRRQERAQADERPRLLQRRPVLLPRRQKSHLPQRPQEEGPPAALRHQRRRLRREGPHRRRQTGSSGPPTGTRTASTSSTPRPITPIRWCGPTTIFTG